MAYNQINSSSNLFQPLQVNSDLKQYRMVNSGSKEFTHSKMHMWITQSLSLIVFSFFLPSTHSLTWLIIQREDRIIDRFS